MKKITLILFLAPFFCLSQKDSSLYKHEIGTNISTFLVGLLNPTADINQGNFTLLYRHHLSNKIAIRIIPSMTKYTRSWEFFGRDYIEELVYQIDSVEQHWIIEQYSRDNRFQFNLGVEKIKSLSERVKLFYGADLLYAFQKEFYHEDYEIRKYDSTSHLYKTTSFDDRVNIQKIEFSSNYIGISPFIGIKYAFGKRLILSANFNMNTATSFTKETNTINFLNTNKTDVSTNRYSDIELWSNGFISDLSLSFLF